MFEIRYVEGVLDDFKKLPAFNQREIMDKIQKQLAHELTRETRNKKPLPGIKPPWPFKEPLRELRVGEYRVFYDVDEDAQQVIVRLIRHKPPYKTTKEIL
jgi:mRNA-degrading endonuclease RelE of RelBE toxin-antitoxin system